MTRPRTFDEALAARRGVRKRGGPPLPLPPEVELVQKQFVAEVAASLTAEDPAAALEAAIQDAAAQIVAKAIMTLESEVRAGRPGPAPALTRQEGHAMDATTWVAKGWTAWAQIESLAAQVVAKAATRITKAQAIDQVLQTPEGKRLYDEYTREQDALRAQVERQRLAPPPLPRGWTRPAWWPRES